MIKSVKCFLLKPVLSLSIGSATMLSFLVTALYGGGGLNCSYTVYPGCTVEGINCEQCFVNQNGASGMLNCERIIDCS